MEFAIEITLAVEDEHHIVLRHPRNQLFDNMVEKVSLSASGASDQKKMLTQHILCEAKSALFNALFNALLLNVRPLYPDGRLWRIRWWFIMLQ